MSAIISIRRLTDRLIPDDAVFLFIFKAWNPRIASYLIILLSGSWLPATAAELVTEQRLALLERRAAKITELTLQLDALKRNNDQLYGQLEQLTHQLAQQERKQLDRYQDLTQQITRLTNKQSTDQSANSTTIPISAEKNSIPTSRVAGPVIPTKPVIQPIKKPSEPVVTIVKNITSAKQAYATALAYIRDAKQPDYPQAITTFQAFINDYPQHMLVANAHYWIGSAYRALHDYAAATTAFRQVVQQYPNSTKVPDALYMIGRTQQNQGNSAAARQSWQQVIAQFPGTDAATFAQEKLLAADNPDHQP